MGFLDRLLGRPEEPREPQRTTGRALSEDEQAIARYRYLLRTAPPEAIEQAHAEAFAQLTPEQRSQVLRELSEEIPPHERQGASDDPRSLARLATRAEMRQPGTLERTFGGMGMGRGPGLGTMLAGSFLASLAGTVLATAIVHQMFDHDPAFADAGMDGDAGGADGGAAPETEYVSDAYGDPGVADTFDSGSDFGGGDFGSDI